MLFTGITAFGLAQSAATRLEGSKPYSPTRLEWLSTKLNALLRRDMTPEDEYSIGFGFIPSEDAIVIVTTALPSVKKSPDGQKRMDLSVATARKIISIESKNKGWSSWLKVKEQHNEPEEPR